MANKSTELQITTPDTVVEFQLNFYNVLVITRKFRDENFTSQNQELTLTKKEAKILKTYLNNIL